MIRYMGTPIYMAPIYQHQSDFNREPSPLTAAHTVSSYTK